MENFVYSKRDLIVAGVAMGIIVTMLGLGFGLAKTDAASIGKIYEFIFGPPGGAAQKYSFQACYLLHTL